MFCNHVLTPAAIANILESPEVRALGTVPLDGFIGPAHVSTVIGTQPYEYFAEEYQRPVVIAGFEPLDVMQAILMLVRQLNEGRAEVENEFTRAVTRDGNVKAKALVAEVFELRRSFEWRGLGEVPYSALRIKEKYRAYDAEARYGVEYRPVADNKACECGAILRGVKKPTDCKVFGTVCTPDNPIGSCMVSSEGACAAHYTYGRFKDARRRARGRMSDGTQPGLHPAGRLQARPRRHDPRQRRQGDRAARRRAVRARLRQRVAGAQNDSARIAMPPGRLVIATDATSCRPCSSPAGTSAASPSTARSTTSRCRGRARSILPRRSCSRKGFRSRT